MFEQIPAVVVNIIADHVISNRRRRQTDERFFIINGTASPSVPDILSAGGSAQPALPPVFLITLHLGRQVVEIEDITFFTLEFGLFELDGRARMLIQHPG